MKRQRVKKVSLIGDSGGTLVAGLYATREPELIDRLVLYGPVGRKGNSYGGRTTDAYSLFTPEPLVEQFAGSVPADERPVFDKKYFTEVWSPLFLDNDPTSRERNPPSVKIPSGRIADAAEINTGKFPYDPSKIQAPTLVIIGEWDTVTQTEGARELSIPSSQRDSALCNHWTRHAHRSIRRISIPTLREMRTFSPAAIRLPAKAQSVFEKVEVFHVGYSATASSLREKT